MKSVLNHVQLLLSSAHSSVCKRYKIQSMTLRALATMWSKMLRGTETQRQMQTFGGFPLRFSLSQY